MPLPEHLLNSPDSWRLFRNGGRVIADVAQQRSGVDFDPDAWEAVLTPGEFALTLLDHFFSTVENCGSFVDQIESWSDQFERLERAFRHFDCQDAADLMPAALEAGLALKACYEADGEPDAVLTTRCEQLESAAGVAASYDKLAAFLRQHTAEFLSGDPEPRPTIP